MHYPLPQTLVDGLIGRWAVRLWIVHECMSTREKRPALTSDPTGAELLRWYWTAQELTGFARHMEVPGGGKQALMARLAVQRLPPGARPGPRPGHAPGLPRCVR